MNPITVVIAPDSFKESMTAQAAAAAMARGVRRVFPDACCVERPMADGGEGTAEVLASALGASRRSVTVRGPHGEPVSAEYALAGDHTAILDAASAIGLGLVAPDQRDPWRSSSQGLGDLMVAALDAGAQRLLIGLGGTATTDGGAGMAQALGVGLNDASGKPVDPTPEGLSELDQVDLTGLDPRLATTDIVIALDVTNPLLGPQGAAAVFGPQKGATPQMVPALDTVLAHWAHTLAAAGRPDLSNEPGAGAAGGLGFALLALGATSRRGIDLVIETTGLEQQATSADLILTGEGSVDAQTANGKTAWGVAQVARRHHVPVIAFGGRVEPGAETMFDCAWSIVPGPVDLATALREGPANLERSVEQALRAYRLGTLNQG